MTICRRTSTNRMALANGIRDATVTYMLSTNAPLRGIACLAVAQFHSHPYLLYSLLVFLL